MGNHFPQWEIISHRGKSFPWSAYIIYIKYVLPCTCGIDTGPYGIDTGPYGIDTGPYIWDREGPYGIDTGPYGLLAGNLLCVQSTMT